MIDIMLDMLLHLESVLIVDAAPPEIINKIHYPVMKIEDAWDCWSCVDPRWQLHYKYFAPSFPHERSVHSW